MSEIKKFGDGSTIIDHKLPKEAFDVYRCLNRHLSKKNGVYPGDDVIARECGIDEKEVEPYIQRLIQAGFIKETKI